MNITMHGLQLARTSRRVRNFMWSRRRVVRAAAVSLSSGLVTTASESSDEPRRPPIGYTASYSTAVRPSLEHAGIVGQRMATVIDAAGRLVNSADNLIKFAVESGPGTVIGVPAPQATIMMI